MTAATRSSASSARLNPNWPHYASAAAVAAVVLGSLLRWGLIDRADPYRCDSYLETGSWLDAGKHSEWQPEGCIHAPPTPSILAQCFPPTSSRTIIFIGDSVVRQLYFAAANLADGTLPVSAEEAGGEKHSDRESTARLGEGKGEVRFEFKWDPFLNTTQTADIISRATHSPSNMLVLGSGLWYLRHPSTGGIASWENMIDKTFATILETQPQPRSDRLPPPLLPAGNPAAVSEAIVFLPVTAPVDALLSPDRAQTISHVDVEAMNADLTARLGPAARTGTGAPPIRMPAVFNEMLVGSETTDGLHWSPKIVRKQAEVLFGWRCNDAAKDVTLKGACCRRYKRVAPVQALVLALAVGWAPVGMFLRSRKLASASTLAYFPAPAASMSITIFGMIIAYLFLADRTTVFLHEQKHYDPLVFGVIMLIALAAGLATMKRGDKDLGFLNREQTDEWKGWMQIAILIYHIFGASKISGIYNAIRVLVAAYLFMTGYGHFTYYLKKNEFGFQRVAMVMVRLNLLSVVLPYTMNTNYAFYYFAPLVSWWYVIIFVTMFIGHQYNNRPLFLIPKMLAGAALVTAFMQQTWIMQHIFDFLAAVFGIQWSAREWSFRVSLDLYIVWGGMFCAYAFIKINEYRLTQKPWWRPAVNTAIGASVLGMIWYFWFELRLENKFVYNTYHALACFVPIFSFIVLRNATPVLRSSSSRIFVFIGQCSLETFILQFHGWMASDTHGVLLVIPGTKWRPINLVISTVVFIWLSYKIAAATGEITEWAVGKGKTKGGKPAASGKGLPPPATAAGPSEPSAAGALAQVVEGTDASAPRPVPESIPMMNRDAGTASTPVGNDGLTEGLDARQPLLAANGDPAEDVSSPRLGTSRDSGFQAYLKKVGALAKQHAAVKLGLVLLVMWIMNLLY